MISIFELFSIGIGPSSSHTVGPMRAAKCFLQECSLDLIERCDRIQVELFGSLALTGRGHGTDKAVILGLLAHTPEEIDPDFVDEILQKVKEKKEINLFGQKKIVFTEADDILFFHEKILPYHPNGISFKLFQGEKELIKRIFYSVGGGFVVAHEDIKQKKDSNKIEEKAPYPFSTYKELFDHTKKANKTIYELVLENEGCFFSQEEIRKKALHLFKVMQDSVQRGCQKQGILPGGLGVQRRAPRLYQSLKRLKDQKGGDPAEIFDWISLWALAVNEENAAGGKIVTAPTNGAAGVIPAVLHYYQTFTEKPNDQGIETFLLVAGAIGILYKTGASISAAEMGCQGEVGVACSMAAAGLTAALGGTTEQIEQAAEIGMEHNLGLTCDPVMGLVQIPCIERNTMGAIKAVNASRLALQGDGSHRVSLDQVIQTMRQVGEDMSTIYKETSQGGLAVNVIEC